MAARKPYLKTPEIKPSLAKLLKDIKGKDVTEEQLREQRVSFAYGNAMGNDSITKDSVRDTISNIRLKRAAS